MFRPDGCWVFPSHHPLGQACGEAEPAISMPAGWPSQSIANKEHSRVLKLLHLDTVGPWIEGELDADLPNMQQRAARLERTRLPPLPTTLRDLDTLPQPSLTKPAPTSQQEVKGDSNTGLLLPNMTLWLPRCWAAVDVRQGLGRERGSIAGEPRPQTPSTGSKVPSDFTYTTRSNTKSLRISRF